MKLQRRRPSAEVPLANKTPREQAWGQVVWRPRQFVERCLSVGKVALFLASPEQFSRWTKDEKENGKPNLKANLRGNLRGNLKDNQKSGSSSERNSKVFTDSEMINNNDQRGPERKS